MEGVYKTHSPDETIRLAENFSKELFPGDVILFEGTLGAGKTTFMQGVAKGLGIARRIISPTFILARTYNTNQNSIERLYHIDLYRMEKESDITTLGINEMITDKKAVVAIEWSEKLEGKLKGNIWTIRCVQVGDRERSFSIEKLYGTN